MAQHDYVIANGTGAAVRSDLNNALAAIVSQNSGATEPATMYAYQWWADTTTGLLKLRNAANNAWITLRELDGTLTIEAGTVSAPGLAFASDLNTGIYSPSADQLAIATNGVERVEFGTSEVVFNDGGTNYDFRIEGDTNANLFFVDASADAVGLGTSSPGYRLTVVDNSSGVQGRFESSSTSGTTLGFVNTATNGRNYRIGSNYVTGNGEFAIYDDTAAASRLFINSSGSVGIGTTSPSSTLDINGDCVVSNTKAYQVKDNGGTARYAMYMSGSLSPSAGNDLYIGNTLANSLVLYTNSAERARIDSSGRLLVGTSTNQGSANLQIKGSDSSCGIFLQRDVDASALTSAGNYLAWLRFGNQQGFVGAEILAETDAAWNSGGDTTDNPGRLVFSTTADGASSPTERMRITNLGVPRFFSSDSGLIQAISAGSATNENIFVGSHSATSTTTGSNCILIKANGDIQNTNNSYTGISDIKLKENIVDAGSQWDDLKALRIVKYNLKPETNQETHTQIGLIAQEVELVCPRLVKDNPDRDAEGNDLGTVTKSVNYSVLYMKAVKALQEAMERIEQLETSNADLLARVTALEAA
jgi:hypothetical protein